MQDESTNDATVTSEIDVPKDIEAKPVQEHAEDENVFTEDLTKAQEELNAEHRASVHVEAEVGPFVVTINEPKVKVETELNTEVKSEAKDEVFMPDEVGIAGDITQPQLDQITATTSLRCCLGVNPIFVHAACACPPRHIYNYNNCYLLT